MMLRKVPKSDILVSTGRSLVLQGKNWTLRNHGMLCQRLLQPEYITSYTTSQFAQIVILRYSESRESVTGVLFQFNP